ncbi:hypothetical protein C7293_00820 [filamentous cyanobacterium CCT1]|nr:hypothetical protein C7293_00820 [filamentous cyanobacterium CCT1]PSN80960.1 hypothetical protein C8B47_03845 [filamentous cyanobacterium CCP4]
MRFFRNGHWWEVDGYIKGRASSYYKCKPACFVESRFYTESEIKQALEKETQIMNQKLQEYGSRGTGRLLAEPSDNTTLVAGNFSEQRTTSIAKVKPYLEKKEPLKVLLVGSRQAVKKTIQALHLLGFANLNDWSAFQNRSNGEEVLSILVQKV